MKKEQIEAIIEKYRRKSEQELRYGDEKCYYFETVADDIETNFEYTLMISMRPKRISLRGVQMDIDAGDASWMFDGDEDL